jgi:hypothetical protein
VVILGKANLAQLAQDDENSETGGRCQNPFDLTRTCGISMTGTGAGIAAGICLNLIIYFIIYSVCFCIIILDNSLRHSKLFSFNP